MARVRTIPGTSEYLQNHPLVISDPQEARGRWQEHWPSPQPLHLEIGCGRGRFLYEAAKVHPERNYLGLELVPEIIRSAVERWSAMEDFPSNLRYLWIHAEELPEIFAPGEVDHIYLHFSDPWPKNRHAKRRLTHENYLNAYEQILHSEGQLSLKTDHPDLYTYSLMTLAQRNWTILSATFDLYAEEPQDNIATEYELRYVEKGLPIKRILATPPLLND